MVKYPVDNTIVIGSLLFSDPDTTYEEDMQILRVIEAYCVSSAPKNRQTIANSGRQFLMILMQLLLNLIAIRSNVKSFRKSIS